jgi:hypothetical protein
MVVSCPFQSRRCVQIRYVSVQFGISIITLSYEHGFECSYTLWKACEIIYNFVNSEIVQKNRYQGVICIGTESVCDPKIVEQSVFRGIYL